MKSLVRFSFLHAERCEDPREDCFEVDEWEIDFGDAKADDGDFDVTLGLMRDGILDSLADACRVFFWFGVDSKEYNCEKSLL